MIQRKKLRDYMQLVNEMVAAKLVENPESFDKGLEAFKHEVVRGLSEGMHAGMKGSKPYDHKRHHPPPTEDESEESEEAEEAPASKKQEPSIDEMIKVEELAKQFAEMGGEEVVVGEESSSEGGESDEAWDTLSAGN